MKKLFALPLFEVFHPAGKSWRIAFTLAEAFHPAGQSKKIAFTLAEVLITLGIIGVVAALTMPVLIAHHKKTEIATSVKKFYSTMSQAVLMSEIDNGPSKDWEKLGIAYDEDDNISPDGQRERALTYFNKYLAKYIKYVKIDENPKDDGMFLNEDGTTNLIKVYLADGTYFFLNNGLCADLKYDANGNKKPNIEGKDLFTFVICPPTALDYGAKGLMHGDFKENNTREKAKTSCINDARRCSNLLMKDGWEFKSDYPYKL